MSSDNLVPFRWPAAWTDPASLQFLAGSPINCLLLDSIGGAAPIVAALEEQARTRGAAETGGPTGGAPGPSARDGERRRGSAEDALAGRRIRIFVAENGRPVINLQIPLAAAGFAIDQVPGLSPDHRSSIVEAIQTGMTGPILEVSDHGDEVRIVIE